MRQGREAFFIKAEKCLLFVIGRRFVCEAKIAHSSEYFLLKIRKNNQKNSLGMKKQTSYLVNLKKNSTFVAVKRIKAFGKSGLANACIA